MFASNCWLTIWDAEQMVYKGNYHNGEAYGLHCSATSSRAIKENGEYVLDEEGKRKYVKDFQGWVDFVGKAFTQVSDAIDRADHKFPIRIHVTNAGVSSWSKDSQDGKKTYGYNFRVFEISEEDDTNGNSKSSKSTSAKAKSQKPTDRFEEAETSDDDLPF